MASSVDQRLILLEIKMLEHQLQNLRARLEASLQNADKKSGYFGELYGAWAEAGGFSEEEIDAVLYRLPDSLEDI